MVAPRDGELFVQIEHPLDKCNHSIVSRCISRIGEIDLANRKAFYINHFDLRKVRCTEKLRSRCESLGFRNARLRARSARHCSISLRNASSTSAVPRFAFVDSANLSKEPLRIASRAKTLAISSHSGTYSQKLRYRTRATEALSLSFGSMRQS